jgi:RNA-binding protein
MRLEETLSGGERETSQKKRIKELKRRSVESEPTVWVGKNGVTEALLGQIRRQLEANEMIKVKVQQAPLQDAEVAEIADKIADKTRSEIVDVRGRTFTIYKQRKTGKALARETGASPQ